MIEPRSPCSALGHSATSEMNITGRLSEAGNLKLIITRPCQKKHTRPSNEYIQEPVDNCQKWTKTLLTF